MKTSGFLLMCDNASNSVKKRCKDSKRKDASGTIVASTGHHAEMHNSTRIDKSGSLPKNKSKSKKLSPRESSGNVSDSIETSNETKSGDGDKSSSRKRQKAHSDPDSGVKVKTQKPSSGPSNVAESGKTVNEKNSGDDHVTSPSGTAVKADGSKNNAKGSNSKRKRRKIRGQERGGNRPSQTSKKILDSLLSEDKHIVEESSRPPEDLPPTSAEVLFASEHWKEPEMPNADVTAETVSEVKPPKKKKRKKQEETKEGTSDKNDKVSSKKQALSYLRLWKKDRENWSFKKLQQIWLIKNMYDPIAIKSKHFETLLDYLSGAKGSARTRLIEKAEAVFEAVKKDEDLAEENGDSLNLQKRPDEVTIKRARQVLQALSE